MKNQFEDLAGKAKLKLLQEADPDRAWTSLEETRHCILCEKTISGHHIRVSRDRRGAIRLRCPTRNCQSTPAEWVHPENPLVSEDAWHDWVRLLDTLCEDDPTQRKPVRRFRPTDVVPTTILRPPQ